MAYLKSAYNAWNKLKSKFEGLPDSVQTVNAFLETFEELHTPYQEQWYMNIANLVGQQYLSRDNASGKLSIPAAPSWRVRLVINKIGTASRILLAKLLPNSPVFYAVPSTMDSEDVAAARLATKVVENIYSSAEFDEIKDELALWVIVAGIVDMFVVYDSDAGRELYIEEKDPVTGMQMTNPITGKPMMKIVPTGDIVFDVASPFEIIRDMSTTRLQECGAICRKKIRSVDYVKERYGVDVPSEKIPSDFDYAVKVMNLVNQDKNTDITQQLKGVCIVKDYYERPTKKYPRGRHLITAGNKELLNSTLKTKLNGKYEWPIVTFTGNKVVGRLMPMDFLQSALPLQWKYNRSRSMMIENLNALSRPKIFAAEGELPSGRFTDEPGEIVEYVPGLSSMGPVPVKMPELPSYFLDNLKYLTAEIDDVMNVHDISRGVLPRRATSGFALSILEEKDTSVLGPVVKSFKVGMESVFSLALGLARDNYNESRLMKIFGKQGELQGIQNWTGADLKSVDDVRIVLDTDLPSSRTGKLEFATGLAEKGLISPKSALKLMNLSHLSDLEEEQPFGDDVRYAEMENFNMLKGIQQIPSEFEEFPAHLAIHLKMLKSKVLPPDIIKIVTLHINQTKQLMQMSQAGSIPPEAQDAQGQAPSGPPAEGPMGPQM